MKLTFEDNNIPSYIKEAVENIINKGGKTNGNIIVEEIAEDEFELYEDNENFIKNHKDTDDIYIVYQSVAGAWNQPLTMVAVVEY